jgi:hypothetical protein
VQQYTIEEIDIDASLHTDGSLEIREILSHDFRGSFSFAYRAISLAGPPRASNRCA